MSAICGLFHLDASPVPAQVIDRMLAAVAGRGPDGSGVWRKGAIAFGHQILHTTPESRHEKLPLANATGEIAITADARLTNRLELCTLFSIPGPEQAATPDSRLILKAYEAWGEDCPRRLSGDFAFAIWDEPQQKLLCARDQIGFRPFFYSISTRQFVFASEIKSVLAASIVPHVLNEEALAEYLFLRLETPTITFYQGILRLPPAHIAIIQDGAFQIRSYWKLEAKTPLKLKSDAEYAEALREKITRAVNDRMRSIYPVGITLSGGLDSSSVAVLAARQLRESGAKLIAVSSTLPENFQGPELDEREFIQAVTDQEGNIDLHFVTAQASSPFDHLEEQFNRYDQPVDPFWDVAYALYRLASELGIRVMINGFGGDMAVSIYGRLALATLFRQGHMTSLINLLKQRAAIEHVHLTSIVRNELLRGLIPVRLLEAYRRMKGKPDVDRLAQTAISAGFARSEAVNKYIEQHRHNQRLNDVYQGILVSTAPENISEVLEHYAIFPGDLKIDTRFPLLDLGILEFMVSLPAEQYILGGWRRSLLRRAMQGILPPKIQWRQTKGPFTPDFHRRVLAAYPKIHELLSATKPNDPVWDYIDRSKILSQMERVQPGQEWTDWEVATQMVVVKGVMTIVFLKWFLTH